MPAKKANIPEFG